MRKSCKARTSLFASQSRRFTVKTWRPDEAGDEEDAGSSEERTGMPLLCACAISVWRSAVNCAIRDVRSGREGDDEAAVEVEDDTEAGREDDAEARDDDPAPLPPAAGANVSSDIVAVIEVIWSEATNVAVAVPAEKGVHMSAYPSAVFENEAPRGSVAVMVAVCPAFGSVAVTGMTTVLPTVVEAWAGAWIAMG